MKMQTGTEAQATKKRKRDPSLVIQQAVQFPRALLTFDLFWDAMTFFAAAYYMYGAIRKPLQSLARRSSLSAEPEAVFERKAHLLISDHFQSVAGDPLFQRACAVFKRTIPRLKPYLPKTLKNGRGSDAPDFYENLTREKIEKIGNLNSAVRSVLMKRPQDVDGRALFEDFASLLAGRQGPKRLPSDVFKIEIIQCYVALCQEGKRPTVPEIARRLFPECWQPGARARQRDEVTREVRNVLRPLGLSLIKLPMH